MKQTRRQRTEQRIVAAARELLAARGLEAVSVREIARRAGVEHVLVARYFGSKEELLAQIIRDETAAITSIVPPGPVPGPAESLEVIRAALRSGLTDHASYIRLILRAELDGLAPETLVSDSSRLPAGLLARWIAETRQHVDQDPHQPPDPALVGAVVVGASVALATLGPWLMTAAGLQPRDLEARRDEIIEILIDIAARAAGATGHGGAKS